MLTSVSIAGADETHLAPESTKTCNKHVDCDAAEAEAAKQGKPERFGKGSVRLVHCNKDECEDCFGA